MTEPIYIIDKAAIILFEDVSINIEEKRLQVFIKKAQDLDLKPFLGQAFFYDFMKAFDADGSLKDDAPEKYKALYNGVDYEDRQGNFLRFDGIVPALVYWTFARFIEADAVRYTATGPVIKQHDQADSLKVSEIAKLVAQQRSVANAHANDIIQFLEIKREDYPLYRYSAKNANSRQPGPRLRSVDRTDVRSGNYYDRNNFLSGLI